MPGKKNWKDVRPETKSPIYFFGASNIFRRTSIIFAVFRSRKHSFKTFSSWSGSGNISTQIYISDKKHGLATWAMVEILVQQKLLHRILTK